MSMFQAVRFAITHGLVPSEKPKTKKELEREREVNEKWQKESQRLENKRQYLHEQYSKISDTAAWFACVDALYACWAEHQRFLISRDDASSDSTAYTTACTYCKENHVNYKDPDIHLSALLHTHNNYIREQVRKNRDVREIVLHALAYVAYIDREIVSSIL